MVIRLTSFLLFQLFQALSLLLAIILRAMVSTVSSRRVDDDLEDDYNGRGRTWEPLLNPQSSQGSGSTRGDERGYHSDIWSSRIRDKVCVSRTRSNY